MDRDLFPKMGARGSQDKLLLISQSKAQPGVANELRSRPVTNERSAVFIPFKTEISSYNTYIFEISFCFQSKSLIWKGKYPMDMITEIKSRVGLGISSSLLHAMRLCIQSKIFVFILHSALCREHSETIFRVCFRSNSYNVFFGCRPAH